MRRKREGEKGERVEDLPGYENYRDVIGFTEIIEFFETWI
jgi:hypothetical protein